MKFRKCLILTILGQKLKQKIFKGPRQIPLGPFWVIFPFSGISCRFGPFSKKVHNSETVEISFFSLKYCLRRHKVQFTIDMRQKKISVQCYLAQNIRIPFFFYQYLGVPDFLHRGFHACWGGVEWNGGWGVPHTSGGTQLIGKC